jgi:asparagine synthetase B (glutamine-hydrolysing)
MTRDGRVDVRRHWDPPTIVDRPASFDEGAEELRALLTASVDQRLGENGTTALWLSGGWDSSAILACATRVLRERPANRKLVVVSMSYPVGNRGREDEAIRSVADRIGVDVTWVQSDDVPLLPPDPVAEAGERDLPFAHAFEMWSRAMVARSRELGARTVLTGTGGDELFAGTNLYLSDLLRNGAWLELAMEWYRIRGRTLNGFRERVVHPALASRASHRDLANPGPFEQKVSPLLREDFVRRHRLREREREAAPYGRYPTLSSTEQLWSVTTPMFPQIRSTLTAAQLRAGVMARTPFLDDRLYRFAMSRPRRERVVARETKRLLRHANAWDPPRRVSRAASGAHRSHDAVHARRDARAGAPTVRRGVRASAARGVRASSTPSACAPTGVSTPNPARDSGCGCTSCSRPSSGCALDGRRLRSRRCRPTRHRSPSRERVTFFRRLEAPRERSLMNRYQVFGGVLCSELEFPELDCTTRSECDWTLTATTTPAPELPLGARWERTRSIRA